jgi:hypothetical protein
VADEIAQKLEYYQALEGVAKLLNSPGEDLVLDVNFLPMLQKLDKSLQFVTDNVF